MINAGTGICIQQLPSFTPIESSRWHAAAQEANLALGLADRRIQRHDETSKWPGIGPQPALRVIHLVAARIDKMIAARVKQINSGNL